MRTLPVVVVSAICRVEGTSAIWKKVRQGDLDEIEADQLIRVFQADLQSSRPDATELVTVPVTTELLSSAARLIPVHDPKALDALQLASALAVREAGPQCGTFACYDKTLSKAAVERLVFDSPDDKYLTRRLQPTSDG